MRKPTYLNANVTEHGKVPPSAIDLEDAVLGAAMLERNGLTSIVDILTPDSFYKIEHQHIFRAIIELFNADKPVDISTVTMHLKASGHLEACGGAYYISKLTDRVASSANAEYHARIIQQKFIQRELIRVAGNIYAEAFEDGADALEILGRLSSEAEKIAGGLSGSQSKCMGEYAQEVIARVDLAAKSKGLTGLETGFADLDKLHGGRQNGHLIIIAGRPAMGKTALALSEAIHIAELDKSVLFVSLEMGAVELTQRAMAADTGIYLERFANGDMDPEHRSRLTLSAAKWKGSKLHIVDDIHTLTAIKAEARRLKEKQGLAAVYVDYLQLIQSTGRGNRENEVSEISRSLKLMARSLNVPVIALSQLSRSVETRGGSKRPMLSDLRESGAIEQDADVVEFVYRPEYYGIDEIDEIGSTNGLALRLIAKNRHGGLADLPMRFEGKLTKFSDWIDPTQDTSRLELTTSVMKPNTNFYEKDHEDQPF
jgi:replicative DNA helicase